MQIVGGLISLINILLALVIGVRLLRRARAQRDRSGVELGLAVYFLFACFLGGSLSCALYMGWADPTMALPLVWEAPIHAAFLVASSFGAAGVYLFTWRTFRRDEDWARTSVTVVLSVMAGSILVIGFSDGFAIQIVAGPAYWTNWLLRNAVFPWMAVEAFRYGALLRRRMAIGLAEPLLTNRFQLWGVWASAVFCLGLADPFARIWYIHLTGTADAWVQTAAVEVVATMLLATSVLGMISAATLLLTFFPTPAYRRWVEGRSATPAAERV